MLTKMSQLAELTKLNPSGVTEIRAGGIHRKIWTFWQQGNGPLPDPKTNRHTAIIWADEGEAVFNLSYSRNGEEAQVFTSLPFGDIPKVIQDLRAAGFDRCYRPMPQQVTNPLVQQPDLPLDKPRQLT